MTCSKCGSAHIILLDENKYYCWDHVPYGRSINEVFERSKQTDDTFKSWIDRECLKKS